MLARLLVRILQTTTTCDDDVRIGTQQGWGSTQSGRTIIFATVDTIQHDSDDTITMPSLTTAYTLHEQYAPHGTYAQQGGSISSIEDLGSTEGVATPTTAPTLFTPNNIHLPDIDILLQITTPNTGRRITRPPGSSADRSPFNRGQYPAAIPVKLYYESRQYTRRSGVGTIANWRLRISEGYDGAFKEWNIVLEPGLYVFVDLGSPLCIIGTNAGSTCLFTFPMATNRAWSHQRIPTPVTCLSALTLGDLHVQQSRGPRVGGFLHPYCYGVPGEFDTCESSRHAVYMPTSVFEEDGIIVASSWAAATYRGRAASWFGVKGGAVIM
jgi:hypothetical protein